MPPPVDGLDNDAVASNSDVDRVRKPRQHCAPCFLAHPLKGRRIRGDPRHESVDGLAELSAQTDATRLIPLPDFQGLRLRLAAGRRPGTPRSTQQFAAHLGPRNRRVRILYVLGPASIQFSPLLVGQLKFTGSLSLCEALPTSHGEFGPITGGEFEELLKLTRRHGVITSRSPVERQFRRTSPMSWGNRARPPVSVRRDFSGLTSCGSPVAAAYAPFRISSVCPRPPTGVAAANYSRPPPRRLSTQGLPRRTVAMSQYVASVRIAFSTSADPGRMASSSTGA